MFPSMKTDNVALQLSGKRIAKFGVWQGKIQTFVDFARIHARLAKEAGNQPSFLSDPATESTNLTEYRP
jgi:hypothetical protein